MILIFTERSFRKTVMVWKIQKLSYLATVTSKIECQLFCIYWNYGLTKILKWTSKNFENFEMCHDHFLSNWTKLSFEEIKNQKVIIMNFGSFACFKNHKIRSPNPDFDTETGLYEISRNSWFFKIIFEDAEITWLSWNPEHIFLISLPLIFHYFYEQTWPQFKVYPKY